MQNSVNINNENKRKFIVTIICICFIVLLLISGSTYAFLIWGTTVNEESIISFDIDGSEISARLSGAPQTVSKLMPAECTNETYALKKEIYLTYENHSEWPAMITVSLGIEDFVSPHGTPSAEDLSYFHFALTTSPDSCSSDIVTDTDGSFEATSGDLFSNVVLKKNVPTDTDSTTEKYYLWVWIDKDYQHINIDDEISDPMQDISFTLVWRGTITNIIDYSGYNIYNVVKSKAVPDNVSSTYVSNPSGIDFFQVSSNNNGRGSYLLSETENDKFPIYYYRGTVGNNNVIFGNFCWKILRTTETGGTKLIYNGVPVDGKCENVGSSTLTHTGVVYGSGNDGLSSGGYSLTERSLLDMNVKANSTVAAGIIFSSDIEYVEVTDPSTGTTSWKYRLIGDKVTSTSNFKAEREALLKEHHYTCFSTTLEECTEVLYFYMVRDNNNYYATLKNGLLLNDLLNIEFNGNSTNAIKSNVHTTVENWYASSLTEFSDYIEDTVYCNDRSLYQPWSNTSSVANTDDAKIHFGAKARVAFTGNVSVDCPYVADSFTVDESKGNGALDYPIGLITFDEAALAGFAWGGSSVDNYLYNGGGVWWSMSPGFVSATGVYIGVIYSTLDHVAVNYIGSSGSGGGVRPVISLKYGVKIADGEGTSVDPFIIGELDHVPAIRIYDPDNESEEKLHIGDFVNYDAGVWTQEEIDNIKVGLVSSPVLANNSLTLPNQPYQFGGFKVGSSRNSTTERPVFNGLGEVKYINDAESDKPITGWRVFDIDETTGEVTLISAGNPEAFYQTNADDAGYSTPYIFSGTIHSDWGEENAAKYMKRDWSPYINSSQRAKSAYILSKDDLQAWYTKYIGTTGDLWDIPTFQTIYSYPRLHNIIDNYSFWWLSSTRAAAGLHFVQGDAGRRLRGGNSVSLGVRINVVLSDDAEFSSKRIGTVELESEHFNDYGGNQVYNIWDLKKID